MTLDQLSQHQTALITKLNCNDELKQRFYSFGLIEGANIQIAHYAIAKKTIEVLVDDTAIAIRNIEAQQIEVAKV
ncbi:MAG: FeoA family protein [Campylobacterota bacterium]|nr:FeoA family protein [Campylobacterota bacterium]